jgi:hypothetical protein
MKKIVCLIVVSLILASAEAQVSVRRTSRRTEKTEKAVATQATHTPVAVAQEKPEQPAVVAEQPAVVRKTTAAEKKKAASRTQANIEGMSLRRQLFEQNQPQVSYANRWQRVIYRELDLTLRRLSLLTFCCLFASADGSVSVAKAVVVSAAACVSAFCSCGTHIVLPKFFSSFSISSRFALSWASSGYCCMRVSPRGFCTLYISPSYLARVKKSSIE